MDSPLLPGKKLGRYEIRSHIGAGGMGEVYLAQDTQLDRTVALKVLPASVAADRQRMQRFIQEAKAASGLNHPNILTVYEIGQEGPSHFIATEFIDGETLRQLLNAGRIEMADALDISAQISSALSAAHAAGIVHRDIKPENIMLRRDGFVKVLDFGLAKLSERVDPEQAVDAEAATKVLVQTEPGVVMGTAAYMSPEQARGKDVDARTDIFSLGAVIYEMLSGRAPFAGETGADIIGALIHKEPQPLSTLAPNIPAELQHIVSKALRKDREERYQTVKSLLVDLKTLKQELDFSAKLERSVSPDSKDALTKNSATAATANAAMENADTQATTARPTSSAAYIVSRIKQHNRSVIIAAAVLLLVVLGFGYWFFARTSSKATQIESIAVLPFVNESGNNDIEYLSDGMTETLISSLSQLPKLNVKARSSVFRYKGKDTNAQTIGKELNVQAILNGTVVQRGSDLALHIELIDAQTESVLWSADYKQPMTNLVLLQSEITRDVSSKLKVKLSGADEEKVRKNYTANPEAYQLYLKGRFYWNRRTAENLKKAIEQFQQAADKDPNYALAYVGLSDCYQLLEDYAGTPASETLPKAKRYAERALEIDDSLAEAHVSLGGIKNKLWQWNDSEKEFKRAIELNPNYPTAHHWYSVYLRFVRRFDESLAEIKLAQDLDPLSLIINDNLAQLYLVRGDVNASIDQYNKIVELDPNFASGRRWLGKAYLRKGAYLEALKELQNAVELSGRATADLGALGYGYAVAGRRADALSILKELGEKYSRHEARGLDLAVVHTGLGEKDQAFVWLEKDYQGHSGTLAYLNWDVYFDSLRGDPRHVDLLRRMGLQK